MKILLLLNVLLLSAAAWAQGTLYINQEGYQPTQDKFVYTDVPAESFTIYDVEKGEPAFEGAFELYREDDPSTALTVYRGAFSTLNTPGTYEVRSGDAVSWQFNIAGNALQEAYYASLKGFYYQRCGGELAEEYAGLWAHPICHTDDGHYHPSTGEEGHRASTGAWHDAGDYGKYIVNAGFSVGVMLLGYEVFPERFNQDDMAIPESGNGIPDLLDENRFELEWMLTMQRDDGAVYHKLTREQFSGIVMPEDDTEKRYLMEVSSTATADFAAVLARAARIYRKYDEDFANACLSAAKAAWDYLKQHPEMFPENGFRNPDGVNTGQYGDHNDGDERLWAAAELYAATGDSYYGEYYESYAADYPFGISWNWPQVVPLAHLTYMYAVENPNEDIVASRTKELMESASALIEKSSGNAFNVAMEPGEYEWGSNSDVLYRAILLTEASRLSGDETFKKTAMLQLNWILGVNPHNVSFISGIGDNPMMNPHQRPSEADDVVGPVPGLLSGGPNQNLQDPKMQELFTPDTPPALCWVDHWESYASNEICINWNAPLVYMLGYYNACGTSSK